MDMDTFVDRCKRDIIEKFKLSGYPRLNFSLSIPLNSNGCDILEVYIRKPPGIPEFIRNKFEALPERAAACPSIERLSMPEWMRGHGLSSGLVRALGALPETHAVFASNVTNKELAQYLENNSEWHIFRNNLPEGHHLARYLEGSPKSFYKVFRY